jgi:hypothetical protein
MGEYISTAPECLVVRVGDDHSGLQARAAYHLIELDGGHFTPGILLEMFMCLDQFTIAIVKSLHDFGPRANISI